MIDRLVIRRFQNPARQSALLRKIVDRIRDSLELKIVLQTAVDEVATLLKLDRCVFFWYFQDLQRIQVVCERIGEGHISSIGHYPLARFGAVSTSIAAGELVVSTGRPQTLTVAQRLMAWLRAQAPAPQTPNLGVLGANANLLVPVRGREGSVGFIACLSDRPRVWSLAEIEFMQAIAQRLEIAIRQAQLYERTQKQARREQLVNQITTQTRQSLDLQTILTEAIAQLLDALAIDRCLVHLVENPNDFNDSLEPATSSESTRTIFRRKHLFEVCRPPFPPSVNDFDTNGPITQWVIQHRQQVVISDITQDVRVGPDNEEYRLAQIKSSLVVPVQGSGSLQAILYLNQCSHVRYWSRDDQELAQAVADQLAISIKQGHLYAQTHQQALESAAQAEHLAAILQNLQRTQAQLIQSEKMSSLGLMVAGVAHEINNPISFIYGNIPYVERYVKDLLRLLEGYQTHYPEPDLALRALNQEIELDFLLRDLPRVLNSMKSGAERIRELVLSLRSFSRLDESHYKSADLHEGLESTLFVLQNHISSDVMVVRQYGILPHVECYPRLLNQVFMNLLMNAVESLTDNQTQPKQITIRTEAFTDHLTSEPWVRISITDTGCGISPEFQSKVFDPFFTTKSTGQGAGLGLTISYQTIVNQHHGQLRFCSQPNLGSEFIVEIPARRTTMLVRNCNLFSNTMENTSTVTGTSIPSQPPNSNSTQRGTESRTI